MKQQKVNPWHSVLVWMLAAVSGSVGLALAYGFRAAPIADAAERARLLMIGCLGLFALSRLLLFVPPRAIRARLARWWVDYVLIGAAVAWWTIRPEAESFILVAGTCYIILVGAVAVFRAAIGALADGLAGRSIGWAAARLLCAAIVLAVIGGSILTLPACRRGGAAVESEHVLAWYHLKLEWLDNTFTAAAALTGTAASVQDIGYHYTRAGQLVILVLMQVGGLGVLCIAGIVAMHFRRLVGWTGADDHFSPAAMRRLVVFICVFTFVAEAVGAAGVYRMWDPSVDLNFKTATEEPAILAALVRERTPWGDRYDEARLFASAFHSVSAFCCCGLTLSRDGYLVYRDLPGPLLAIVPLMFLGSLGAPVLYELVRRMTRRNDIGLEGTSKDTWLTLGGGLAALIVGAAALYAIESTRDCQLRYPRDRTPGRLMVDSASASPSPTTQPVRSHVPGDAGVATTQPAQREVIQFSAGTGSRARAERLNTMTPGNRMRASIYHAEAARSGGARAARLDESSLSPASEFVLIGLMLVGGGAGGAAGGLRIGIVLLLLGAAMRAGRPAPPRAQTADSLESDPPRALGAAAAVATAMLLLIGLVALVLMYRESGTAAACLFEAVSACCNVGLSAGLTSDLSLAGRITIVLAMILGRVLPLAILLRCLVPSPAVLVRPLVPSAPASPPVPREDDDAPIPLE